MSNAMPTILVQTRSIKQKMKTILIPSAAALLLSACVGGGGVFGGSQVTESLKNEAYATSEYYVNQALKTTRVEDQQTYRLLAIRKLLDENKLVEAQNMFTEVTPVLNPLQRTEFNLLSAQLAALQKQDAQAKGLLNQVSVATLSQSQAGRYYKIAAKIAENQRDVIEAVRARVMMDNYLTDTRARQENNDVIWAMLRNTNRGKLENTAVNAGEIGLAGWLALVLTYNQNISNPSQLPQAINNWKAQYPNHSAALLLPTELQNVTSFQQTNVSSVALLLPLSGEGKIFGDMIKQGFDDARGSDSIAVRTFDTDTAPVETLISQAKQQGAQAIVGPLLKNRVDEMLQSPEINNINVLALNSTPNVRAIAQVCYYGLSPEAEARSGADRIYRDNFTQVIVSAPQGDFGQRSADAFAQRWQQITNTDADVRYYNQPLDIVAALENIGAVQGKALYILGTAEQLLEAKQALDNAGLSGQVAIYSSSRSNSPNNGAEFRLAMEGVKFSEIPLLADEESDIFKKAESLAQSDYSMMRLYAMGSDAWMLSNKFNELRQVPGYRISGLTGTLSAGTNCNVEREMTWLQYRNGALVNAN